MSLSLKRLNQKQLIVLIETLIIKVNQLNLNNFNSNKSPPAYESEIKIKKSLFKN